MLYTRLFWRVCLNLEEIEKWREAGKLARDAPHFGKELIQQDKKMLDVTERITSLSGIILTDL